MMINKLTLYIFLLVGFQISFSQENTESIEAMLNDFAEIEPALNETIKIDVSGLTLYEFLNSIAIEHQINVSADSNLNSIVESSFFDIPVKDVFLFVTKKYSLSIEIINNIIVFTKKIDQLPLPKKVEPKEIDISYNNENDFLSIKLSNDSLSAVAHKIADITNKNLILSPEVKDLKVSAYILNRPFEQVLDMMAKSNKLIVTLDDNGFYYLEKDILPANEKRSSSGSSGKNGLKELKSSAEIQVSENGLLTIKAYDADVTALLAELADQLNINYFMYNKPDGLTTTFVADNATFDDLLPHIFKGKDFTYKKIDDFYLIGDQNVEGLRSMELIQLENRTIETVIETLPQRLSENLEVKEFIELNGFMVSGSTPRILEIKEYIKQIDKVVPMILIEVMIVQYQKAYDFQSGIKAGIDNQNRTTGGVLFPTTDVTINSTSVNKLIDAFNGFGIFNLGKVTEQFYLNLKLLENNSIINLHSTPKISTLNGHDAKLSIGETNYYFEQNNRLINSGLGNDVLQSGQWKSTEANLSVSIKPFVSKDEQITLTIVVEKSAFLARSGENAPPGKATQQFESLVRVKNGEMILLGGLDELEKSNSGTGTPFFSRIPIIKWFFSSRSKNKRKAKLHVFIKPTVVY